MDVEHNTDSDEEDAGSYNDCLGIPSLRVRSSAFWLIIFICKCRLVTFVSSDYCRFVLVTRGTDMLILWPGVEFDVHIPGVKASALTGPFDQSVSS